MGRTKEREASYSFTDPYYYRTNCLVVKKGSGLEGIKGLSELAGKNVTLTTQLGTGWVNLLDQDVYKRQELYYKSVTKD